MTYIFNDEMALRLLMMMMIVAVVVVVNVGWFVAVVVDDLV